MGVARLAVARPRAVSEVLSADTLPNRLVFVRCTHATRTRKRLTLYPIVTRASLQHSLPHISSTRVNNLSVSFLDVMKTRVRSELLEHFGYEDDQRGKGKRPPLVRIYYRC